MPSKSVNFKNTEYIINPQYKREENIRQSSISQQSLSVVILLRPLNELGLFKRYGSLSS